jgi:DNA polymerase
MRSMVNADNRLRGAFIANGASGTGRFSSKGAQLHNYPRLTAKDPDAVRLLMMSGADLPGSTLLALKSMLRPSIRAQRGMIVRADWSAIEARGLPWLTGRAAAAHYLDAFRDPNRDIYVEQSHAAGLGGARQPGKVVVLALGYGGGEGALTVMCKGYGVNIENKGLVVKRWRASNRWAVEFWYELQRVALSVIRSRSTKWQHVGRVAFSYSEKGHISCLRMGLPSGRILYYPFPAIDKAERGENMLYLKAAWKPKADAKAWPRARAWGGLLAENATQATCADLLRHALVKAIKGGLPIVGHVHDELIAEGAGKSLKAELARAMLDIPAWAAGFPVAVETDAAKHFRK